MRQSPAERPKLCVLPIDIHVSVEASFGERAEAWMYERNSEEVARIQTTNDDLEKLVREPSQESVVEGFADVCHVEICGRLCTEDG